MAQYLIQRCRVEQRGNRVVPGADVATDLGEVVIEALTRFSPTNGEKPGQRTVIV